MSDASFYRIGRTGPAKRVASAVEAVAAGDGDSFAWLQYREASREELGELVGLLFDGTYESVASNFLFDAVKTRSIHVDSRYMLWTMAEVDGAAHLLREMGVIK